VGLRRFEAEVIRRLVAGLIVVGLAVGIWVLWPWDDAVPTPTTVPTATESSTTVMSTTTTPTTLPVTSTTSSTGTHVVTTVEEAEAVLRELIYRRLLGIYNEDRRGLAEIAASQAALDSAVEAFGQIRFLTEPFPEGVQLSNAEMIRGDQACLAIWAEVDVSAFQGEGAVSSAVVVLRNVDGSWRWASVWQHREDLWEADCDAQLEPLS
jgi:hypothetical protein